MLLVVTRRPTATALSRLLVGDGFDPAGDDKAREAALTLLDALEAFILEETDDYDHDQ